MPVPSHIDSSSTPSNVTPIQIPSDEDSEDDTTVVRIDRSDDDENFPSYESFSDEDDSFQRELDAELDLQISEMMNETSRHIEQELQRQIDEQFQNQLDEQMEQYFSQATCRSIEDTSPPTSIGIQSTPSNTSIPVKNVATVKGINEQIQIVIDQYKSSLKLQDD